MSIDLKKHKKVELNEIGFYLKLLYQEYGQCSNLRYAQLIEENFNLVCTEQDVDNYQTLHIELEDFERASRMIQYGYNEHDLG